MHYTVIKSKTVETLIEHVQGELEKGWEPLGGIAIEASIDEGNTNSITYYQSLVRRDVAIQNPSSPRPKSQLPG